MTYVEEIIYDFVKKIIESSKEFEERMHQYEEDYGGLTSSEYELCEEYDLMIMGFLKSYVKYLNIISESKD